MTKFDPWYAQQSEMPGPDGKPIRRLTVEDIAKARKLMFPNKAALIAYYKRLGLIDKAASSRIAGEQK